MSQKKFSESTARLFGNFQRRVIRETKDANDGVGFDPSSIITIMNIILPLISQLAALCHKPVPPTPPVPASLAAQGITQDTYEKAFQSNWGGTEAWIPSKNHYHPAAINHSAKEIADKNGTKKKLEKPAAIAAFDTARKETVETIALAMHESL